MTQTHTLDAYGAVPESEDSPTDSDEYGTPRWFISRLQKHVGVFDLDPAAGAERARIAHQRYTKEDNGLTKEWGRPDVDTIFLNPPYSDPEPFLGQLKEAVDPTDPDKASLGISITRGDTSTGWFHDHLTAAEYLFFYDGRYSFHGASNDAGFSCTVAIFGDPPNSLLRDLATDGVFYTQTEIDAAVQQESIQQLATDGCGAATALPVSTPSTAGPTPGNGHSLDFVAPRDELTIELSENQLVGSDLPDEIHVRVMPNGKSLKPESGEIEIDVEGVTNDGTQVCGRIRNNPNTLTSVEVTIAVGMDHWEVATPKKIINHSSTV